jgi:hypothetical protein
MGQMLRFAQHDTIRNMRRVGRVAQATRRVGICWAVPPLAGLPNLPILTALNRQECLFYRFLLTERGASSRMMHSILKDEKIRITQQD